MQTNFVSESLGVACTMNVIAPQRPKEGGYPVLYLLHGLSDDHSNWMRLTSLERYVRLLDLIVVMPAVNRSYYCDQVVGQKYFTFVADELPKIAGALFNVKAGRENTFAAGLSMGGYGAFKLGLTYPDRYCAVASLSGLVDVAGIAQTLSGIGGTEAEKQRSSELKSSFGEPQDILGSNNDLFALADKVAAGEQQPKMFMACGTEDFLYKSNVKFRDAFMDKLPIEYFEEPGGHTWDFWDRYIEKVVNWLPLER